MVLLRLYRLANPNKLAQAMTSIASEANHLPGNDEELT